jgi:hypothetical protein
MAKSKPKTRVNPTQQLDPLKVNERLYRQCAKVLDELENKKNEITWRERIAGLIAVGRVQTIFMNLRREHLDEPTAGGKVRKYADAFKAHDARGRARSARPDVAERIATDWDEPDLGGDDADTAA